MTITDIMTGLGFTAPSSAKSDSSKAMVNYDSFLQLLIAQLKNQDPTAPVDASEQLAQLASFSQVEQTIQTNQKLDSLLTGISLTQASGYVGKYIESADGSAKGTIASVKIYTDGIIATLEGGEKVLVQPGVTFADAPPKAQQTPQT